MGARYTCGTDGRRQLVAARDGSDGRPVVNAVDFVEVVDLEAPAFALRQRLLLVRCFHPADAAGLGADNVAIEGGVRVGPIAVLEAGSLPVLAAAPPPTLPAAWLVVLRDRIAADPTDAPEHWLVVLVDQRGDFSTYTLRLVGALGSDAPPAGFDARLCAVPFSFKVECPSAFDCVPPEAGPPEPVPGPVIDYLAKDFASFRRLMVDRLSVTLGDWVERSPADLGVTLVEVLAHAADQLSYHQDAVGTEAYLGTARRRTSVRRHARLLDYALHEGCNARAWVQVLAKEGVILDGAAPAIPAGTPFLSEVPGPAVVPTARLPEVRALSPVWFEAMHDLAVLTPAHNEIRLHTWGDAACSLPAGATRATLVDAADPADALRLHAGDVIVFEEHDPDQGDDPRRRHAVRLSTEPVHAFDEVLEQPVLEVAWDDEDALPFSLCLHEVEREVVDGAGVVTVQTVPLGVARGNIVLADHGRTETGGELVVERARHWRPRLPEPDLTFAVPYTPEQSAAAALHADPREAVPRVVLEDADDTWWPVRDLLASAPTATEFVVEMSEDRVPWLRFGDDRLGRHPSEGAVLAATWRVGNGLAGNVGAEALCRVVGDALVDAVAAVRNPMAAAGGTDPEPLERARLHAPAAFRTQERAVTEADWAEVCGRHPGVQRAVATIRWTGSWHTVFLTLDRIGGAEVDDAFVEEMLAFLEPYRLAGYDLEVDPPVLVPLDVAISVCVAADHFQEHVEEALYRRFSTGVLPDGRKAFFHPDHHTFGGSVYLSSVVAAAMEVPGVAWVDTRPVAEDVEHRFHRLHEGPLDELRAGVIAMGRLEIAQLDHDPNRPEAGRLRFYLRGGLR